MNLSNYLEKKIKRIVMRKKRKRIRTPEQILKSNIKQAIRLIKTGEYNDKRKDHRILIVLAYKHGYINRKDLSILKEI